jgi:hypothetical protein
MWTGAIEKSFFKSSYALTHKLESIDPEMGRPEELKEKLGAGLISRISVQGIWMKQVSRA